MPSRKRARSPAEAEASLVIETVNSRARMGLEPGTAAIGDASVQLKRNGQKNARDELKDGLRFHRNPPSIKLWK